MNCFADFDRYVNGERNERTRREVQALRLERRLRGDGQPRSGARLAAFFAKGTRPLLHVARLAG